MINANLAMFIPLQQTYTKLTYSKVTETSHLIMAFGTDKFLSVQVYLRGRSKVFFQAECRGGGGKLCLTLKGQTV